MQRLCWAGFEGVSSVFFSLLRLGCRCFIFARLAPQGYLSQLVIDLEQNSLSISEDLTFAEDCVDKHI